MKMMMTKTIGKINNFESDLRKLIEEKIVNDCADWKKILLPILTSEEGLKTAKIIAHERSKMKIFPLSDDVFNAFKYCPYDKLKVVIIGNEPYAGEMNGKPQAHGLAFSYKKSNELDTHIPYSLENILKEVENDIYDGLQLPPPLTDLTRWAEQGVLLINSTWTIQKGEVRSHFKLWDNITKEFLKKLSNTNSGIIYVLWGNDAKSYKEYINTKSNFILEASHPAVERHGKNKGFFGCKHFSQINKILKENNGEDYTILW